MAKNEEDKKTNVEWNKGKGQEKNGLIQRQIPMNENRCRKEQLIFYPPGPISLYFLRPT